jgi:hypothetical protein
MKAMSNSPLVSYTKISPNKTSPRNHKIDTITIHCVVGQASVESLGNVFAPTSRKASSNYGVGFDGRIGMYVEEKDRSWCSSSASNDHRAITIEVASDTTHPYAVTDKAYAALIELLVDICKRNGIKELKWKGDKSLIGQVDKQNMTVHRWFANKSCPGDYLYERHGAIAEAVNARLGKPIPDAGNAHINENMSQQGLYKVQTGAFTVKSNATALQTKLKSQGFDTYLVQSGKYYKVQVGAYGVKSNAEAMMKKLHNAGYDAFITYDEKVSSASQISVGDKVKVLKAETYTGGTFKTYYPVYDVLQVNGDRVVIGIGKTVTAAVKSSNIQAV